MVDKMDIMSVAAASIAMHQSQLDQAVNASPLAKVKQKKDKEM